MKNLSQTNAKSNNENLIYNCRKESKEGKRNGPLTRCEGGIRC